MHSLNYWSLISVKSDFGGKEQVTKPFCTQSADNSLSINRNYFVLSSDLVELLCALVSLNSQLCQVQRCKVKFKKKKKKRGCVNVAHCDSCGLYTLCNTHLIKVEWRQVFSAHSPLLGVAARLQSFVFGQEEAHPGAGGGRRVLPCEEEANQHPRNLVVIQGSPVSEGKTKIIFRTVGCCNRILKISAAVQTCWWFSLMVILNRH